MRQRIEGAMRRIHEGEGSAWADDARLAFEVALHPDELPEGLAPGRNDCGGSECVVHVRILPDDVDVDAKLEQLWQRFEGVELEDVAQHPDAEDEVVLFTRKPSG